MRVISIVQSMQHYTTDSNIEVERGGRNIGLRIAFDGHHYHGWQSQPNAHTIEGTVRAALRQVEKRQEIALIGASRTDTGVHANGQYANFHTSHFAIPAEKYAAAINRYLPASITILQSQEHPRSFHARYSATRRTYLYTILLSNRRSPRDANHYAIRPRIPAIARCNRALAALCGTHDFYSFAKNDGSERSTIRTVYEAAIYPQGRCIQVKISANAFLRNMVRSIVGTILDDECCTPTYIERMLYNRNRELCAETAPACGLSLDWISYE